MTRKAIISVVIMLVACLLASAQTLNYSTYKPTKKIAITLLSNWTAPEKPPTEDVVTPLLREKTGVTAKVIFGPGR